MYNILLIDDDEKILEINETYLLYHGYEVRCAKSIKQAIELLAIFTPNCIVLDIRLPDGNGLSALDKIRRLSDAPVIFLSSLATEQNIISCFHAGAADYMTKPFSPKILELRIIARIKDYLEKIKVNNVMTYGHLTIDQGAKIVRYKDQKINLTPKEFAILLFLSKNENIAYQLNDIYTAIWGLHDEGIPLTVQAHVSNLRRKLKKACEGKQYIKTIWGNGYRFSSLKDTKYDS